MPKTDKHRETTIAWERGRLRSSLEEIARAVHPITINSARGLARQSLDALVSHGFDRQAELKEARDWVLKYRGYDVAIQHL